MHTNGRAGALVRVVSVPGGGSPNCGVQRSAPLTFRWMSGAVTFPLMLAAYSYPALSLSWALWSRSAAEPRALSAATRATATARAKNLLEDIIFRLCFEKKVVQRS